MKKGFLVVIVVVLAYFGAFKIFDYLSSRPDAYVHDGDNKVAYFVIPSIDGKSEIVIKPGQKEYAELCKKPHDDHKIAPLQEVSDN